MLLEIVDGGFGGFFRAMRGFANLAFEYITRAICLLALIVSAYFIFPPTSLFSPPLAFANACVEQAHLVPFIQGLCLGRATTVPASRGLWVLCSWKWGSWVDGREASGKCRFKQC